MKRRSFIQTGSLMTLPLVLNGWQIRAMSKSAFFVDGDEYNDRILVLIELNGGNDGLNTLVPLDQYDNLANVRQNIILPQNSLLDIGSNNALHPSMIGVKSLFDSGKSAIIQSVAYPNQNRSHFRSTDIWNSGSKADEFITSGWLGRYFDKNFQGYPEGYPNEEYPDPFAITMGYIVSNTCQGIGSNFSFALNSVESLAPLDTTVEGEFDNTCYGKELKFVKESIDQSNAYVTSLTTAYENGKNEIDYPEGNRLSNQLKTVAKLISGGCKTKVYVVSLGGFDTHADQIQGGDAKTGAHANLLLQLSDAMYAFQSDLEALNVDDKVLSMTYSEFGRRIKSNLSNGTDHGTAAPLFVFGNCVLPGIYGNNPIIDTQVEVEEGIPMQYDFRAVYASVLTEWLGASTETVDEVMFEHFNFIPFVKACGTSSVSDNKTINFDLKAYPNPCTNYIEISFESPGDYIGLSLFDVRGAMVKDLIHKKLEQGPIKYRIEMSDVSSGMYFIHLRIGESVKNIKILKT
jgi:uncharacterized protein (DUF1501 family)